MERRRMGRHGLEVPALCLGTMTFGLQVDEPGSKAILDKAFDHQLRFLDTADAYPLGGNRDTVGETEAIIGRWMRERGNRADILLATKCFAPTRRGPNGYGLSRQHIMESIDASLTRLDTDYVDLYQAHGFDPNTPIEETLRAFEDIVRAGKARYVGCSNYPAWRLGEALRAAERLGVAGYISIQPRYNLLYRDIEVELSVVALNTFLTRNWVCFRFQLADCSSRLRAPFVVRFELKRQLERGSVSGKSFFLKWESIA